MRTIRAGDRGQIAMRSTSSRRLGENNIVTKNHRSNVRQAREASRILEFLAHAGHAKKLRRPVSSEEYDAILRSAVKDRRAKHRKRKQRAEDNYRVPACAHS